METRESRLLSGILEQADQSAQQLVEDAKRQAAVILEEAKQKAEREVEQERKALDQKLQQVQMRLQANMASAKRRALLRYGDERYRMVLERCLSYLDARTVSAHLPAWIAEAAIGLDLKEAKVAASVQCPVTEDQLKKACALVKKVTGSDIILHLDPKPIRSLGVVVSSMDGMVSFNNQVEIRLRRQDRMVRSMIQEYT